MVNYYSLQLRSKKKRFDLVSGDIFRSVGPVRFVVKVVYRDYFLAKEVDGFKVVFKFVRCNSRVSFYGNDREVSAVSVRPLIARKLVCKKGVLDA